jgi:enterochelin esterase-like enzyme
MDLTRTSPFPSRHIPPRPVDVWLPPGYPDVGGRRYPVIYMHDGQNLFDPALAYGGITWGVGEALTGLVEEGRAQAAIIVGVWNNPPRWREYMPQKPLASPPAADLAKRFRREQGGDPFSDRYLRFLVEELKPWVDAHYRSQAEQPATFLMGSSMGGLISLYGLEQYPQVFGGAACLSTHWPAGGEVLVDALGAGLPPAGAHRLYFDFGTETLDWNYEPFQQRFDEHLQRAGYRAEVDWITRKFAGAEHSEASWRLRVHIPLQFLLG